MAFSAAGSGRITAERASEILLGTRILVVEPEFLIALDIQRILEVAEARTTIFARSVEEASTLSDRWMEFDLAIVDISNGDEAAVMLAGALRQAGVALVISTSDLRHRHGLVILQGTPVVLKPYPEVELLAACRSALGARPRR